MRRITESTGLKKIILVLGVMAGMALGAMPVKATATAGAAVGTTPSSILSSDATLRALVVEPGSMSPAFSPAVTDYTIVVESGVTDITVSGGVSDENAQITAASGFKNLAEETNQALITVTAQDGSTLTYHFTIIRGGEAGAAGTPQETQEAGAIGTPQETQAGQDAPQSADAPLVFQLDGVTYQISPSFDSSFLPQGCVKQDITFQEQTVEGAYFEAGQMTLVYAISGKDGTGDFYIYDKKSGVSSLFIQIKTGNTNFIVPVKTQEEAPAGFYEENMQWNNTYLSAYQVTNSSISGARDFYLFYAVDQNGTYGYYLYDAVQGTCQRFLEYASAMGGGVRSGGINAAVIIGMMAIVMTGLLMVICSLAVKNRELTADKELGKEKKSSGAVLSEAGKATADKIEVKTTAVGNTEDRARENSAQELPIEITDVEDMDVKSERGRKEQQGVLAEKEKEEAEQRAARRAALEREIAKDEKARAKRGAAEKRKQQDVQRQADRQALAERRAKERLEQAERLRTQKQGEEKTNAQESGMKTIVKKEVTERGITYTTGRIPITVVTPEKPAKKRNPVPIYTLEKRTVSLTRESGPDELDDDFEFEFIHIDKD